MSVVDTFALLATLLLVKHYIADLPLQTTWMVTTKGIFLHPGGIIHAGIHAVGSLLVLVPAAHLGGKFPVEAAFAVAMAEFLAHYIIDFSKMNIDSQAGASHPVFAGGAYQGQMVTNVFFYYSFVADQCLHFLTYIAMVGYLLR